MTDSTISIVTPGRGRLAVVVDLVNERKGTWTVICPLPKTKPGNGRWKLRCDCGREKEIATSNWRSGKGTRHCPDCNPKTQYNQLPEGEASFNLLYDDYRRKARKRGISFFLTTEQFRELTRQDCSYCGASPGQVRKTGSGTPYTYTGVDRVDPAIGYMLGNVASCCWYCNRAKADLTLDQWKMRTAVLWWRMCE